MAAAYPKRDSHFAHRYVRLLYKICAAQYIGVDAVALLVCIAHQEDAKRYKGAVTYFNGQLAPMLGFAKWERLSKARDIAIQGGFLHYENHGKRSPGIYWVTIPDEHLEVSDAPTDEGEPTYQDGIILGRKQGWIDGYNCCATKHGIESLSPSLYPYEGYKQGMNEGINRGINRDSRRGQTGTQEGDKQGEPSTLSLSLEETVPSPGPEIQEQEAASAACAEPPKTADSAPTEPTAITVVVDPLEPSSFLFPTKGKGGKTWTLPQAKLDEYHEVYPDLDVNAQMRAARQWCRDNPSKQKTPRGMLGFLTRWLNRAQDGARGRLPLLGNHGSVMDPRGNHAAFELYRESLEGPTDGDE